MFFSYRDVPYIPIGGIILGLVLVTRAAPIVPETVVPTDQVRSLEGLTQFRLEVLPLSRDLTSAGLDAERIQDGWADALQEEGFAVNDESTPLLELRISTLVDSNEPDMVAINLVLMLYQEVNVQRIRGKLSVPTYVRLQVGIENHRDMARTIPGVLRIMRHRFLQDCQVANDS